MQSLIKSKQKLFPMMCAVLVLFLSLMVPMKPVFAADGFGGTSETVSNSFSYVEWGFYDIAFDSNGGSGSIQKISHIRFDETQTLPSNVFTRTGYTFNGWNTKADGTGSAYADKASVVRLTNVNDAVVTLYAQWKANSYTVTYDANYATGESVPTISKTSDTVLFGSAYGELPTASRVGYTFDGWYTESKGGSKIETSTEVTTAKNHTLYAHWTAYHYNIAFNANGGSGTMATQDVTYDKTAILSNNEFVRDGYQLLGWSTTNGGSVKYENQAAIRNLTDNNGATIQLYAVWIPATDVTKYATGEAATHDCNKYLVSTYNSSQHWQYCSICGKKFNVHNHSYTTVGEYSCTVASGYQYNKCSCGYSYQLPKKAHTFNGVWLPCDDRAQHYQYCTNPACGGIWTTSGVCVNSAGQRLGCTTGISGTCVYCGAYRSGDAHGLLINSDVVTTRNVDSTVITSTENLPCIDGCGKLLGTYTITTRRTSDTRTDADLVFNSYLNVGSNYFVTAGNCAGIAVSNPFTVDSHSRNGNTIYAHAHVDYNRDTLSPNEYEFHFDVSPVGSSEFVSGTAGGHGATYAHCHGAFRNDTVAPVATSASVSYTGNSNGYATSVRLNATYYEYASKNVYVRVLDSNKSTVLADYRSASATTSNGTYYSTTISLPIEVNGSKTVYVQAKDSFGNVSALTAVTVSNVDAKPPVITSGNLDSAWAKSKTYNLTATDTGSGNLQAQASGGSYAAMTKNGTTYSKSYTYTGDIYDSVSIIYNVKDAAGNVATKTISVSKLDNTAPHINKVNVNDLTVTVTADDINAKLNKSGSSVAQYGYINMDAGTSTTITWVNANKFSVPAAGNYVIYAKDAVGNISNPYAINVGASTVFNTN